jgi:H+/Cl- antiporter ClcA
MAFPNKLSQLCTPSLVYFVISVIGITMSIFQNIGNDDRYCLGSFACQVPSTIAVFVVKIVYVLFWTWILNMMCNDGHVNIAWFLVLLPFVLLFMILYLVMVNQKKSKHTMEGLTSNKQKPGSTCLWKNDYGKHECK